MSRKSKLTNYGLTRRDVVHDGYMKEEEPVRKKMGKMMSKLIDSEIFSGRVFMSSAAIVF